jgi:cell wall assembly regulator SMI1
MSIEFRNGRSLSDADVSAFERESGVQLPRDYRDFVRLHDGAEPDANTFDVGNTNSAAVNQFIPLQYIISERKYVEHVEFLPVAWASCGNYVCIDLERGGVVFWDHEDPSGDLRLAESFSQFLEMLAPLHVTTIELKPGQVKEAWIDPDFLKGLE